MVICGSTTKHRLLTMTAAWYFWYKHSFTFFHKWDNGNMQKICTDSTWKCCTVILHCKAPVNFWHTNVRFCQHLQNSKFTHIRIWHYMCACVYNLLFMYVFIFSCLCFTMHKDFQNDRWGMVLTHEFLVLHPKAKVYA